MTKSYSKTQTERLIIVDELIKKYGNEHIIKLIKLDQGNEVPIFTGKMSIGETYTMIKRFPRDFENSEGIQRILNDEKAKNIARLVLTDAKRYTSPNAVVIAVQNGTPYSKIEQHPTESDMVYYRIDLAKVRESIAGAKVDKDGYIEDDQEVFVGVLIDGHYRTAGLYDAGKLDFEVPITVYIDLSRPDIINVFTNINKHQNKPSTTHTLGMEAVAGRIK